jgi:phosphatidylglycerophosphate synthase
MPDSRTLTGRVAVAQNDGTLHSSLLTAGITAIVGSILVAQADWSGHQLLVSLLAFGILATFVSLRWGGRFPGTRFGEANQVTMLRAGLVCLVGGAVFASGAAMGGSWPLAGLVGLVLILDGVDGWLARKLGIATSFGARFDMEIDAILLLILALLVWQADRAGLWVLAIGLMRYGFVGASWFCPALRLPLAPSWRRKAVCVLQGVILMVCLLPPIAPEFAAALAAAALATLCASFAIDVRDLLDRPAEDELVAESQRA